LLVFIDPTDITCDVFSCMIHVGNIGTHLDTSTSRTKVYLMTENFHGKRYTPLQNAIAMLIYKVD